MILGQGVTKDLLEYAAGFPVSFLNSSGQNGGCSYEPSQSFVYNSSANATLNFPEDVTHVVDLALSGFNIIQLPKHMYQKVQ
jgi:hypothetical protein